jgi:N utilization substance protein A
VRNITTELRSERIDVVPFSDDPVEFIQNALQPARVREVRLDEETGTATVIVQEQQLSLAIGKEGQNARLAARLTGWRIDIRSGSEDEEVATEVWTDGNDIVEVVETTDVVEIESTEEVVAATDDAANETADVESVEVGEE